MCGITGWYRNPEHPLTKRDVKRFESISRELLLAISPRGRDSVGMYLEDSDGNSFDFRRCMEAEKTTTCKAYKKWAKESFSPKSSLFIGHTRFATVGGVTQLNAHPLYDRKKTIVGVHNGGLPNYKEIEKQNSLYKYFTGQTDSVRIFANIAKYTEGLTDLNDIKEKTAEAISEFNGQAALAFKFKDHPYLWTYKDGNPLFILYDKDLRTMFFSSYFHDQKKVLEVHSIDAEEYTLPTQEVYAWNSLAFDETLRYNSPSIPAKLKTVYAGFRGSDSWWHKRDEKTTTSFGDFNPVSDCAVCREMIVKAKGYYVVVDKIGASNNQFPKTSRFCEVCYTFLEEFLSFLGVTVRFIDTGSSKVVIDNGNIKGKLEVIEGGKKDKQEKYDSCQMVCDFAAHTIGCSCKSCTMAIQEAAEQFADKLSLSNPVVTDEDL